MKELKTVIIQNNQIINVGEWNYQYVDITNDDGKMSQVALNPLPTDAKIEQREMTYTVERGWQLVDMPKSLTQEERITELENTILMLLEVL